MCLGHFVHIKKKTGTKVEQTVYGMATNSPETRRHHPTHTHKKKYNLAIERYIQFFIVLIVY